MARSFTPSSPQTPLSTATPVTLTSINGAPVNTINVGGAPQLRFTSTVNYLDYFDFTYILHRNTRSDDQLIISVKGIGNTPPIVRDLMTITLNASYFTGCFTPSTGIAFWRGIVFPDDLASGTYKIYYTQKNKANTWVVSSLPLNGTLI